MSKAAAPADKVALFDTLVEQFPKVDRKGATIPYTSINGHMFSLLTKEGKLALRLDEDDREAFLREHRTTLCEQNGVVLKEYVVVPDVLLERTNDLKRYFQRSLDYVSLLKPKPTTRKKSAKKTKKKAATRKKVTRKKASRKTSKKTKKKTAKKAKKKPAKSSKKTARKTASKKAARRPARKKSTKKRPR